MRRGLISPTTAKRSETGTETIRDQANVQNYFAEDILKQAGTTK